ncbi:MAG: hypothetical protein JW965_08845 [Bacteroidales bacterium]|nr:hypothetical protein [Bacteroidales bacterium]
MRRLIIHIIVIQLLIISLPAYSLPHFLSASPVAIILTGNSSAHYSHLPSVLLNVAGRCNKGLYPDEYPVENNGFSEYVNSTEVEFLINERHSTIKLLVIPWACQDGSAWIEGRADFYKGLLLIADDIKPDKIDLGQNIPNPCDTITRIEFETYKEGFVELCLFNEYGYKCYEMVTDYLQPGKYSVIFDVKCLPDGIYFYCLRTGEEILVRRMILIHSY